MQVVRLDHLTMHIHLESQRTFTEPVRRSRHIGITGEQRLAIVSPLANMERKINVTTPASFGQLRFPISTLLTPFCPAVSIRESAKKP